MLYLGGFANRISTVADRVNLQSKWAESATWLIEPGSMRQLVSTNFLSIQTFVLPSRQQAIPVRLLYRIKRYLQECDVLGPGPNRNRPNSGICSANIAAAGQAFYSAAACADNRGRNRGELHNEQKDFRRESPFFYGRS